MRHAETVLRFLGRQYLAGAPPDERWAISHKSGKQLSLAARVIGQQERTRTDTANDLA
jgi:hypothetical protein